MSDVAIVMLIMGLALVYILCLLGAMAAMAKKAAQTAADAISHIPSQTQTLQAFHAFAKKNGYAIKPATSNHHVFVKGRGWLTSLTELHLTLQADGSAILKVVEGVNFLFKIIYFPINAPTFLGKPIRIHKVKKINALLNDLNAPSIDFEIAQPKGKIRFKK